MKSRSEIWLRALEELGAQCSVSTARDAQTFVSRIRQEGEEFLTLTLPNYGKEFERSLAVEGIPRDLFQGWSRSKGSVEFVSYDSANRVTEHKSETITGMPRFLAGFLDLVFDAHIQVGLSASKEELENLGPLHPVLKSTWDKEQVTRMAEAITAVRQLTLMFSKEKALPAQSKVDNAIASYVKTDQELAAPLQDERAAILFEGKRLERTRKVLRLMFGDALAFVDGEIYHQRLVPGHGPGATADALKGNQKWTLPTWHDRLETVFPFGVYAIPNFRHSWRYAEVEHLAPGDEPPVKVVVVPKTQRAPRLIAIEPTCMQYIQQAIMKSLVQRLEGHYISSWFVGFTDQEPNNFLAAIGSDDGSLATLDLSEASDRVANWLVEDLFADFPHFLEGIDACRSTRAKLPSGDIVTLQKFASMGSAMTFPIEAMVFAAIVVERVLSSTGTPVSRRSILALRDRVRVYGDDIIVPTDCAESAIGGLETFGFKVNRAKSFWTGKFRESCGKEYWNGIDVSIVKFRTTLPATQRDVPELVSTVATRNQLYKAGLWRTAGLLDSVIEPILKGKYPIVSEESPVLGRIDNSIRYHVDGFEESTQSPFVWGYVVKSKIPYNGIDDLPALMKCLVQQVGTQSTDTEHLTRSGRPQAVSIKLVKGSPF